VILLFTFLFWKLAIFVPPVEKPVIGFWDAAFVSITTFSTLGATGVEPAGGTGKLLLSLESFAGTIFLGLLAAVAYRKIAR